MTGASGERMSQSEARVARSYAWSIAIWLGGVLPVLLVAVIMATVYGLISGPLVYAGALVVSLPVVAFLFAFGRFLRDSDEYVRALTLRRLVWAAAVVMAFTNTWGLVEQIAGAPHFPLFLLAPLFSMVFGVVGFFVRSVR